MIFVNIETEVIVALITAGLAAVAAVGVELLRRNREAAADIAATREQVQNSHTTNLRDDIDSLHDDVRTILSELSAARTDLRVEREERLALARRLETHTHAA